MAEIIWTEPALQELDALAEYVALDNPEAASHLFEKVFDKVERLENFPQSGRVPPELPNSVYSPSGQPLAVTPVGRCALC
ncbi:MAG: type II toxin-antitoxin system RelE/ParE family toxin [Thiopseudomonas sp.]|nr:type II toxin-antitoxin system RelE/ParE family toxin [Thiopseudomonas sp.]MCK9466555.1 type II toxin-antitoxin system RelE/ParE family toxin [Thiopseudomonas sp.]